jgi:uncharacterized membrane protein YhaH (DUF805 family)
MANRNDPMETRHTVLKVTATVISVAVAVMLGLFCKAIGRWLGMREMVLYAVQLISMGVFFSLTRALIYGMAGVARAGKTPQSGHPTENASMPQADPTTRARADVALPRCGRVTYLVITCVPPAVIMLVSALLCGFLFEDRYAVRYGEILGAALIVTLWLPMWLVTSVSRLHDLDRSGWWALTLLIPVVNLVPFVYLCCGPGTPGSNRFGLSEEDESRIPVARTPKYSVG